MNEMSIDEPSKKFSFEVEWSQRQSWARCPRLAVPEMWLCDPERGITNRNKTRLRNDQLHAVSRFKPMSRVAFSCSVQVTNEILRRQTCRHVYCMANIKCAWFLKKFILIFQVLKTCSDRAELQKRTWLINPYTLIKFKSPKIIGTCIQSTNWESWTCYQLVTLVYVSLVLPVTQIQIWVI